MKKLPVTKADRKVWRRAAALTQKAFDKKLERTIKKTIAGITGPSRPPPKQSRETTPGRAKVRVTEWKKDPQGVLSRELVTEAAAPAT